MSDAEYWRLLGEEEIVASLTAAAKILPTHAKNVIVFMGDGMSNPTITAARYEFT